MPVTGLDNGPRKKAKINHPSSGSDSLQKDVADIQAALNDTNPENIVSGQIYRATIAEGG